MSRIQTKLTESKLWRRLFSMVIMLSIVLPQSGIAAVSDSTFYIEPTLFSSATASLSVIVTGQDAKAAARAVQRVGGQITSDLWLIDAVGAEIPADQLATLAAMPEIVSIVDNKSVEGASSGPHCDPEQTASHGPCASRPGWVSDRREKKDLRQLDDKQVAPFLRLPDGGLVAVAEKSSVTYLNADGSQRQHIDNLPFTKDDDGADRRTGWFVILYRRTAR